MTDASFPLHNLGQISVATATSVDSSLEDTIGSTSRGYSWFVTFPIDLGDASSLALSTENGPESTMSSAGTLTGTDPVVGVTEVVKGGLQTEYVSARRCHARLMIISIIMFGIMDIEIEIP